MFLLWPEPAETIRELLMEPGEHKVIANEIEQLTDEELLAILDEAEMMGFDLLSGEEE